jgi:hypothetical protein
MAPKPTFISNTANIIIGAGMLYQSSRDVALTTVSALTVPTPTPTAFNVSTADSLLIGLGDLLCNSTVVNTFLCAEAAALPVVQSIIWGTVGWNVIVTPAFGTAPVTTAAGVTRVWTNRGATKGGVEFSATAKGKGLDCDQSQMPVGWADQSKSFGIKAGLTEATAQNFAMVAGIKDGTGLVLQYNATDANRRDRYLCVGKAPNSKNRYFILHDGRNQGVSTQKNSLADQIVYSLDVQGIADTTMTPSGFDMLDS